MSFVIHALIGLMPGDPIDLMISADPRLSPADAAQLRAVYGLDRPIVERYAGWVSRVAAGDLGYSRLHARPVASVLTPALAHTVVLMGVSFVLSVAIALPAGMLAAARAGSRFDTAVNLAAYVGLSTPPFWLALLLIIVFAVHLGVVPAGGTGTGDVGSGILHLVLPVATLTVASVGSHLRYVRAAMLDVLGQDYMRTARAKGLSEHRTLLGHALRNALIPIVTVLALDFGALFSGALVTETVFARPGMGRLIFDAVMGNDVPLALVALLLATAVTLVGNFVADVAYAILDPRLSFGGVER
jgi:peptide/nickel transport system permease protein